VFEKRLKWFTLLLAGVTLVVVLRLIEIQVVRAEHYQALADGMLTQPTRYYRAARGSILDRHGRVLISDTPAFDVALHYAVLSGESERYLRALAGQRRRRGLAPPGQTLEDTLTELRCGVAETWERLAALTGRPVEELLDVGELVRRRVERIREQRERLLGVVEPIREEQSFHAVVGGVDDELALRARMELEQYPWVAVQPGTRRVAHEADDLVHVLGRLGAASRERLEEDPLAYDELRRLVPGDLCGISGVERAAELNLRGTRGRVTFHFDGSVAERIEPRRGRDVYLTIDAALQRRVLEIVQKAVDGSEFPAGGSAVVIDVARREILALVSYPVYAHDSFSQEYERLRRDTRWLPLRFRAVADQYPPGSTCKAIALVGALADGVAGPQERIHCRGFLLPGQPTLFRCWIYNQYGTTHDDSHNPAGQSAEDAVRNSCNIYFFTLGQRLGAARICHWFEQFGLGRLQGTGLIEESPGIVPTESWLRAAQGRSHQTADAWNYAIGQGEVTTTPLQAANVAATIAAGRWHVAGSERGRRHGPRRPARAARLRAVRQDRFCAGYAARAPQRVHAGMAGRAPPGGHRRKRAGRAGNGPARAVRRRSRGGAAAHRRAAHGGALPALAAGSAAALARLVHRLHAAGRHAARGRSAEPGLRRGGDHRVRRQRRPRGRPGGPGHRPGGPVWLFLAWSDHE
jgi:cell division protein FtsI/penicillin-binding protein 2